MPELQATAAARPLCVDLDGTLAKSDTLVDSLLVLARRRPALLPGLLRQLFRGKAAFKAYVTAHTALDVAHLPYNSQVLRFLEEQRQQGREIYLATGANQALAERVAAHLKLFAGVLGSGAETNLTGNRKLAGLRAHLGEAEFDYIGNDTPDLPLLAHATEKLVANPSLRLRRKLASRGIRPAQVFEERAGTLESLLKALRPHQWAKNVLIFAPLLLAHSLAAKGLLAALLAFCCFSLTASATYIVNDLLDIEADRYHPQKRNRPFAAGDLSPIAGAAFALVLLLVAFGGAYLLPRGFLGWLGIYLVSTLLYSSWLKRIPLVDVLILSGLYTLRLLVGSAATGFPISHWLAGFAGFLFFSLAIAKRYAELNNVRAGGAVPRNGRGYILADIDQLRSFGTASAFAAVVVFANYISSLKVVELYRHPALLWLIMPLMLLWLCRVWLLASRGELHEDPVIFALTDRVSLLIGLVVAAVAFLAI